MSEQAERPPAKTNGAGARSPHSRDDADRGAVPGVVPAVDVSALPGAAPMLRARHIGLAPATKAA